TKRDMRVVSCQYVEREQSDEVDRDVRELPEPELARHPRQEGDQHDGAGEQQRGQRARDPAARQTRLTTRRPKRPVGRMTSTRSSTARAVGSLSSLPTKLT